MRFSQSGFCTWKSALFLVCRFCISKISNKKQNLDKILESKNEKNKVVANLQKSENIFLKKIKQQQKQSRLIEEQIKRIIEEEIKAARAKLK